MFDDTTILISLSQHDSQTTMQRRTTTSHASTPSSAPQTKPQAKPQTKPQAARFLRNPLAYAAYAFTHASVLVSACGVLLSACAIWFAASLTASCSSGTATDSRSIVFPASGVSYQRHVQPFFDLSCTFAGCHNSQSPAAGVSFASYFGFIGRAGLVVSGRPEQSVLIQVVDTRLATARVHPRSFQDRITTNQIEGLKTWIREGAELN
jgi:hypothetical protein